MVGGGSVLRDDMVNKCHEEHNVPGNQRHIQCRTRCWLGDKHDLFQNPYSTQVSFQAEDLAPMPTPQYLLPVDPAVIRC